MIGLSIEKPINGSAIYGKFSAGYSKNINIYVANRLFNVPVIIMDLSNIGDGVNALIGRDILNQTFIDLDCPNSRLSFEKTEISSSFNSIDIINDEKAIVINSFVEGINTICSIDTGSNSALMLKRSWVNKNISVKNHILASWKGSDLTGYSGFSMTSIRELCVGGFAMHDVPSQISENRWPYPANIGFPIIKKFRSLWDVQNGKIYLSASKDALDTPIEHDRSGMSLSTDNGALIVKYVSPFGPAFDNGIKVGDEIAMINGKDARLLTKNSITELLRGKYSKHLFIKMSNGDEHNINLKKYF